MNKIQKSQKGFAHLEALLLLIIIAIIAFTGWYVWHSTHQANKSLSSLTNPSLSGLKKKPGQGKSSIDLEKSSPNLVNYSASNSSNGINLTSASDVNKLTDASDSFKQFVSGEFKKHSGSPSPCGNAYGLFVQKIYKDQFALGGESQCKHTDKLWAKISDKWTEIGSTQTSFDCSLLEQYKVPFAIVGQCIKNGQTINNTQQ